MLIVSNRASRSTIRIGDLRDLVDIYSDASNDTDEQLSYTGLPFLADVPAKVDHVGGHEKEQTTFVRYEVTCHYFDNITESMRVTVTEGPFKDDNLNIGEIETVRTHGRPAFLVLHCIKVD